MNPIDLFTRLLSDSDRGVHDDDDDDFASERWDIWLLAGALVVGVAMGYSYRIWLADRVAWHHVVDLTSGVIPMLLLMTLVPAALMCLLARGWKLAIPGLYVQAFYVGIIWCSIPRGTSLMTLSHMNPAQLFTGLGWIGIFFWIGFKHALLTMVLVGLSQLKGADLGRVSRARTSSGGLQPPVA